jgi:glycosyltransferase involved in cell wall biosynthesis
MLPGAARFAVGLLSYRADALIVATYRKLWLAGLAARLARVPRVVARVGLESHQPYNRKYRFVLRHLVSDVVVNSRSQAAPFLAFPGVEVRRVHVIYNYYEPRPRGSPERIRQELGLDPGVRVLGAVARLASQKRLERLLEATALLPGVHCVLAGDGPRRAELQARTAALGIADRVHFLGHREDVADVLALLEVFVICSDREGLSNAMLEALAAGVPVVSTAVSGAEDALEPLAGGVAPGIVTTPEPSAIAAAIARILDDDALRCAMAAAGPRRIAERFAGEGVLDAWEGVLAGHHR